MQYKDFKGFYWTGSVVNKFTEKDDRVIDNVPRGDTHFYQKATLSPRFDLGLIQNPSEWVVAVERLEINCNSIPYWIYNSAENVKIIDANTRHYARAQQLIDINANNLACLVEFRGTVEAIFGIEEKPYFSLQEVIAGLNTGNINNMINQWDLRWFLTPDSEVQMLLRRKERLDNLDIRNLDHTALTITFLGGLHQILGIHPVIHLNQSARGYDNLNVRFGRSPVVDQLYASPLGYYLNPEDKNRGQQDTPRLIEEFPQVNRHDILGHNVPINGGPAGVGYHNGLPQAPVNRYFTNAVVPLGRDDTILNSAKIQNILEIDQKNIRRTWIDTWQHVDSALMTTNPRADTRDNLQHIYIECLGLGIKSDRFDIGYESIMTDFGGLSGTFNTTSNKSQLGMQPRQKVVYNPTVRRLLNMDQTTPITWFRINAMYRDWGNEFQIIQLAPGEAFHIKLAFFQKEPGAK